jgi:hypothetical protein
MNFIPPQLLGFSVKSDLVQVGWRTQPQVNAMVGDVARNTLIDGLKQYTTTPVSGPAVPSLQGLDDEQLGIVGANFIALMMTQAGAKVVQPSGSGFVGITVWAAAIEPFLLGYGVSPVVAAGLSLRDQLQMYLELLTGRLGAVVSIAAARMCSDQDGTTPEDTLTSDDDAFVFVDFTNYSGETLQNLVFDLVFDAAAPVAPALILTPGATPTTDPRHFTLSYPGPLAAGATGTVSFAVETTACPNGAYGYDLSLSSYQVLARSTPPFWMDQILTVGPAAGTTGGGQ